MKIVTTDTPSDEIEPFCGAAHTLSVLVNNQPGVLMRICQVFARRGYNIDSLVVSQGRRPEFSCMTIGITGNADGLEQIIKQVNKLIDVIHCQEHATENAVVKEMLLIKIKLAPEQRTDALQIIDHFSGKTVDLTPDSMIALIHGNSSKIDSATRMFSQFDVVETACTGKVVMARGAQAT